MRVIECNLCGQVIQAEDDEELVGAFQAHVADEHADAGIDEEQVRGMVERDAYEATDA
jgi:predicted small metal-binding protein